MEALQLLKKNDITVKINTIILPGYNDDQIVEVAKQVSHLGADVMNCIPVYPNVDTAFESIQEPSKQKIHDLQQAISTYIKPMTHCTRCRADAAGLLGSDIKDSVSIMQKIARQPLFATEKRPYIAVASQEGILVNKHLGEAEEFLIYTDTPHGYLHIATRKAPSPGSGDLRWIMLAKTLHDCNAILVNGAGANPMSMLKSMGFKIIQMNGLIEAGLDAIYNGKPLSPLQNITDFKCGNDCGGNGGGCG